MWSTNCECVYYFTHREGCSSTSDRLCIHSQNFTISSILSTISSKFIVGHSALFHFIFFKGSVAVYYYKG